MTGSRSVGISVRSAAPVPDHGLDGPEAGRQVGWTGPAA